MTARLILVYNADAGIVVGLFDLAHKLVSPATYPCSLCGVTYGTFGMNRQWRDYLAALPLPVAFFHRPDFHAAFPTFVNAPLPLVARDDDGVLTILLDAAVLTSLTTVNALIAALAERIDATGRSGNAAAD
jgi:hypothetical protein